MTNLFLIIAASIIMAAAFEVKNLILVMFFGIIAGLIYGHVAWKADKLDDLVRGQNKLDSFVEAEDIFSNACCKSCQKSPSDCKMTPDNDLSCAGFELAELDFDEEK
jgi:hypothetical protein